MSEAAKQTPATLIFEPHNGYGTEIDGEPMPFGYISAAAGRPIFELNPVFEMPVYVMRKMAIGFAASPEMFKALSDVVTFAALYKGQMETVAGDEALAALGEAAFSALSKAEGRQP